MTITPVVGDRSRCVNPLALNVKTSQEVKESEGQRGTGRDREGEGGTERDREGQGGTKRNREGEGGTERDREGQGGTERNREGQGGTGRDREEQGRIPLLLADSSVPIRSSFSGTSSNCRCANLKQFHIHINGYTQTHAYT